jgi:transposase
MFGKVGNKSCFRWKVPPGEEDADEGGAVGRPKKLDLAAFQRLAALARQTTGRVGLSSFIITKVLQKEVNNMDINYNITNTWVKVFLNKLDLRYKKSSNPAQKVQPAEKVAAAIKLLRMKLVWLQHEYNVPWARVWNMDETAVRILPTSDHGWAQKNVKANFIGDAKSLVTVNVAAGAVEGVRHQVIFGGKTNRVHPIGPQPVHQQVTHTDTQSHGRRLAFAGSNWQVQSLLAAMPTLASTLIWPEKFYVHRYWDTLTTHAENWTTICRATLVPYLQPASLVGQRQCVVM